MNLKEKLVSRLVDGGCDTTTLSTEFVKKIRKSVKHKLGEISVVISHSHTCVHDRARESLEEGELLLNQGWIEYVSNWLV